MFQTIDIKAYRGLKNITLQNLSRVNILVGENNTGKTSILEAIQLLRDPEVVDNVLSIAKKRQPRNIMVQSANLIPFDEFLYSFPVQGEQKDIVIYATDYELKKWHIELCGTIKKEIFDKYGLFDEKYKLLEDYPFYVNLAFNNEKIGYIDYPTIQYELGGISTASNRNPLLDQDYVTLFKDVLSQKDIHLSHMTKRALNYRIDKITKKYNSFLVQLLYIDVVIMLCLNKAGVIKG